MTPPDPGEAPVKVLIVDDEAANRQLLASLLEREGYELLEAEDGAEGLAIVEREPVALVLLDVLMPKMSGLEACRRMRAARPALKIVMVTALNDRATRLLALEEGADDLLTKPVDDLELNIRVRNLVQLERLRRREQEALARATLEEATHRSEALLREAQRLSHVGSFELDIVRNEVWWSEELYRLFRVDAATFSGSKSEVFFGLIHPDDRPQVVKRLGVSTSSGADAVGEFRLRHADGEVVHVSIAAEVRKDEAGRPVRLFGAIQDITGFKRTEAALRFLSTELFRSRGPGFFDALAQAVAEVLNVEVGFVGAFSGADRSALHTIGLAVDGVATPWQTVEIASTPCGAILEQGQLFLASGTTERFPACTISGAIAAVGCAGVALRDSAGHPLGVVGVMSRRPLSHPADTHAILQLFATHAAAELSRQRDDARFRELFEFAPDAILTVDERGVVTTANHLSGVIFDCAPDALVGLTCEQILPQSPILAALQAFKQGTRAPSSAWSPAEARRRDGTPFPGELMLRGIATDDGSLMVVGVRDRTETLRAEAERRALEAQLLQAQKMEAIGTLAGGIAHDFNNILMAVAANVELAREDLPVEHSARELIEEIGTATSRAERLVKQILTFSRKHEPNRAQVKVVAVVAEAGKLLRAALPAGVELTIRCEEQGPVVSADATQLHQVLMNLGTNAWHALEGRAGHVEITEDTVVLDRRTGPLEPGRYARIEVRDDGAGIEPALLERIFEPFFTTKPVGKGSGLGLSVVHGIVREHGGSVTVESALGKGTTFRVLLPIVEAVAAPSLAPRNRAVRGEGKRVLYLDDEESLVRAGMRLLERLGFAVIGYQDPQSALSWLSSHPQEVDAIVADYNMPTLSGVEVARAARAIRSDLPLVLLSGHFDEQIREQAAAAGVRELMGKPFDPSALGAAIVDLTQA